MAEKMFTHKLVNDDRVLYTPSNFAKESLCFLQEIGTLKAIKPHTSSRTNLDSFLFFIVNSGSGILKYDNSIYNLNEGDCAFIDCHKPYSHETSNDLWSLSWIHFSGNFVSQIYHKYIERGGENAFSPKNLNELKMCYSNLFQTASSKDYIKDMKINELLCHILTLLMDETCYDDKISTSYEKKKMLDVIRYYLTINYDKQITLDDLSKRFFINKFYLIRLFKEHFGITINDYLLQVRITQAKYLLRFTDEPIEKIGLDCGIGPITYFSRVFKKIEGLSPSIYRKQW